MDNILAKDKFLYKLKNDLLEKDNILYSEIREWRIPVKLKMYLLINNMTMTAFCEQINYDLTYISKIAKGKRKPGIKLAKIIENATGGQVTVEDLLKGD